MKTAMFEITRRKLVGVAWLGTGAVFSGLGLRALGRDPKHERQDHARRLSHGAPRPRRGSNLPIDRGDPRPPVAPLRQGGHDPLRAASPSTSRQAPEPLDPLEQMLLLATVTGNTRCAFFSRTTTREMREAAKLHHRRGRAELSPLGGLQHLGVLLHRR